MLIVLPNSTPLEKEVAKRVRRGIKLLDRVTPGWFKPINPATLEVSDAGFCVFAQASHDFEKGIVQVAAEALRKKIPVELLKPGTKLNKWGDTAEDRFFKVPRIDVFYYGFDVDYTLLKLTPNQRRMDVWPVITAAWTAVVKQKKAHAAAAK